MDYCAVNPSAPGPTVPAPSSPGQKPPTPNPTPQPFVGASAVLSLRDRANECSERNPCGECMGDCDGDVECAGSLRCFFRVNLETVPGCAGQGTVGRDYCAFDNRSVTNGNNNNNNQPQTNGNGNNNQNNNNVANNNGNGNDNGRDNKVLNTRNQQCTPNNPCGECQGVSSVDWLMVSCRIPLCWIPPLFDFVS